LSLILFRISTATVITIVVIFITDHSHIKICCWVGEAEGLLLWLPVSDVRMGLLCGIAMRFELLRLVVTQFYFRTTQKCKRYLKLAFMYLVLFRRRNMSLVPFRAILTLPPSSMGFCDGNFSRGGQERKLPSIRTPSKITPRARHQKESPKSTNYKPRSILLTLASPTSTTVYKWKRHMTLRNGS